MGLVGTEPGERPVFDKMFRRGKDDAAVEADQRLTQLNFCFSQVATRKRDSFLAQKLIYRTTGSTNVVNDAFSELMAKNSTIELSTYIEEFLDSYGAYNASGLHRYGPTIRLCLLPFSRIFLQGL